MNKRRNRRLDRSYRIFLNVFRVIFLIFALTPILWGIRTSLLANPNDKSLIPTAVTLANYIEYLAPNSVFWPAMGNSLVVALGTIACLLPLVTLGSYALGRIDFKGKGFGKVFLYLPLIPAIALLIQLGTIMNNLKLINNRFAVVLLNTVFLSPFTMWILRNFMRSISPSLEEAAYIDGCGKLGALTRVILPNALPGLITVIIYVFIQSWLNYMYAYTVINDSAKMTVPQMVQSFIGIYSSNYTTLCTFSIIAMVPPLIFFCFFQKWFIAGLFGNIQK